MINFPSTSEPPLFGGYSEWLAHTSIRFMAIERMTAHEDFVSVLQQVTEQMLAEQNSEGQAEPQAVDHLKIPFKDEESQFTVCSFDHFALSLLGTMVSFFLLLVRLILIIIIAIGPSSTLNAFLK